MALKHVAPNVDPADFIVVPNVCAVDEFRMTNPDGSFVANINATFLDKLVAHMTEREQLTGDLAPIVVGHTVEGLLETEQPPVVGFARNWHRGELGATSRQAAFFDAWIYKTQVDLARKFPRRSCEVWASRYEVDPISLLGATTPARDLGLMKLSRDGSQIVNSPGDMIMPDDDKKKNEPKGEPKADPKESGDAKGKAGKDDQILAMLSQILEVLQGGAGAGAAGAAPAPGAGAPADAGAAGAGGDQMSDDDFNSLMQSLMAGKGGDEPKGDDKSRAGDKPTPNQGGTDYPNQNNVVKMSREQQELADLKAEVTRMKVKDALVKLSRPDIANPEDVQFVEDLVALPPDIRQRTIERLAKTPAAPGGSVHLSRALEGAVVAPGAGPKRMTRDEATKLSRIATEQKKTFEQVAAENGFDLRTN